MLTTCYSISSINRQKRRFNSNRADYHDRQSCYIEEPSHRLANLKLRKSGVVLPFGAADGDFNIPNRTIFSSDGKWLSEDLADPWAPGSEHVSCIEIDGGSHGRCVALMM
jgi:hypothetical protein